MARALSTQVKEFMDMWLAPSLVPLPKSFITTEFVQYTKYPYNHSGKFSRLYEYNVKDGFELITKTPFGIDMMGYPELREHTKFVLKQFGETHFEGLDKYKQVVIHYETYTGLINLESGTEDVILEIKMKKVMEQKPLQ